MAEPQILIFGSPTCFVSGLLYRELRRREVPCYLADFQDFERLGANISFRADSDGDRIDFEDLFREIEVSTDHLRSVFFRESFPKVSHRRNDPSLFQRMHAPEAQEHHWEQILRFAGSVLTYLSHRCFCLYPRNEPLHAAAKMMQLGLAADLGLRVPETYMGNDFDAMRRFVEETGQVISKPFFPRQVFHEGLSYQTHTSTFTLKDLDEIGETRYPVILQEAILARKDIRVGVVGHRVMASEISLQGTERDEEIVDFRYHETLQRYGGAVNAEFARHELPEEVAESCREFLRRLGLQYGMLDFLLTPEGEYVFLECNPKGMHGEVDAGDHDVIGAIADLLVDPDGLQLR